MDLEKLKEQGILSPLDILFARFLERLSRKENPELGLAAALVSSYTREGHVCLDITAKGQEPMGKGEEGEPILICPDPETWRSRIEDTVVVGCPGEFTPLILDSAHRLYLLRYWEYQEKLAHFIRERIRDAGRGTDRALLKQGLERLFPLDSPEAASTEKDWQKVAAAVACSRRVAIITGGPGTGKTFTVAKILALLLEQARPETLRIALVSPTGKGAARLQQAMASVRGRLQCTEAIQEAIPVEASTIHRLLGAIPGSPYFRYNGRNPLPVDVLVVDEASMVDMALMSKMVQALPDHSRLILLGDKDQLASVEAGAVLGDICDTGRHHAYSQGFCEELREITGYDLGLHAGEDNAGPGIQDSIVELKKSYRFGPDSGIQALSRAINQGDQDRAWNILNSKDQEDIAWRKLPGPDGLVPFLQGIVETGFRRAMEAKDPLTALGLYEGYRILCGLREGPFGVSALNRLIQGILRRQGRIRDQGRWFAGRPVMVTQNDYELQVFNGDTGIILPDPEQGHELRAFFPSLEGGFKKIHPIRLPEHETVYAMTVHKSQGSEFDQVLLILPDRDSPVLTRELIYTAVTRARKHVEVWGREAVFRAAVSRRTERTSGLRDALWNG